MTQNCCLKHLQILFDELMATLAKQGQPGLTDKTAPPIMKCCDCISCYCITEVKVKKKKEKKLHFQLSSPTFITVVTEDE